MNPGVHEAVVVKTGLPDSLEVRLQGGKDTLGPEDRMRRHEPSTGAHLPVQTILLAEDNDDLREVLGIYLDMMGYGVVSCCDGQIASALFDSGSPVDALITDLEMPGKSGIELARELTLIRPSLPVLIVSGASITLAMSREMEIRNWRYLSKPCGLPSILTTLQALLPPVLPAQSMVTNASDNDREHEYLQCVA